MSARSVTDLDPTPTATGSLAEGRDRRLGRLAARQHGVFSLEQARRCGLAPSTVARRARSGIYERVHPNVYVVSGAPGSLLARYAAAVLAVSSPGDPAALSHRSAAQLWGLDAGTAAIHVVSRTHHPVELEGVVAHRTRALPNHHRTTRAGIPVTVPERTLCELAGCTDDERLGRAVADAVRRDLITPVGLAAMMSELGRIRGKTCLRRILAEMSPPGRDAHEDLGSSFLRTMSAAGLPPSATDHETRDGDGGRHLLDAVYLAEDYDLVEPVWIELDGERSRSDPLEDHRRREDLLVAAGWPRPLRYGWADLTERPDRVIAEVRAALQARRAAPDHRVGP